MATCPEQQPFRSPPDKQAERSSGYKGIRLRKWGKWVSEVRKPKCRDKIWLGSYETAEQAARAYDAAVFCLRGPRAQFNFPDCVPDIPHASSLSPQEIQVAATKHALEQTDNLSDALREERGSPSISPSISEIEAPSEGHPVSREQSESATLENLFGDSDTNADAYSNLERLPSPDAAAWDFALTPAATEEQGYHFLDPPDLWD